MVAAVLSALVMEIRRYTKRVAAEDQLELLDDDLDLSSDSDSDYKDM